MGPCLLVCLAMLALCAIPTSALANSRPGCFVGLDVQPGFDRAPSPCVPVDTPGPVSGPVASGPGAGRVTVFAGRQALTYDADRLVARADLPASAIRASGFSDGSVWFSTVSGSLGQLTPDGVVHLAATPAR